MQIGSRYTKHASSEMVTERACSISWKKGTFTNLLNPWSRIILEKLTSLQVVKKFPAFYGTRRFITAFTSACHLSLSWASSIQSIPPHPTSWRSILILSSHLRLGLPIGLFPSRFPTKTLYTPLSYPMRATCPVHLILLDFITHTILDEERQFYIIKLRYYNWWRNIYYNINNRVIQNTLISVEMSNVVYQDVMQWSFGQYTATFWMMCCL